MDVERSKEVFGQRNEVDKVYFGVSRKEEAERGEEESVRKD